MHVSISSRGALDAPSSGSTAAFAVQNMHKEHSSALELAKARVSDTLQVFRQRGVLSHHDYAADVPASLHGAPRTAEVSLLVASQLDYTVSATLMLTMGAWSVNLVPYIAGEQRCAGAPAADEQLRVSGL